MAAAVTAIRKNNERKALENERKERETEGLPVAPSTPKSAPKAKVRDAATFVNADYGNITPHFPGVFFPVGTGRLLPHQLAACKLYNTGLITWSIASVIVSHRLPRTSLSSLLPSSKSIPFSLLAVLVLAFSLVLSLARVRRSSSGLLDSYADLQLFRHRRRPLL